MKEYLSPIALKTLMTEVSGASSTGEEWIAEGLHVSEVHLQAIKPCLVITKMPLYRRLGMKKTITPQLLRKLHE
jgi:hypothetical protein